MCSHAANQRATWSKYCLWVFRKCSSDLTYNARITPPLPPTHKHLMTITAVAYNIFAVCVCVCGPCSGRSGKIRVLSMKIGLLSLSKGHLEEKYKCKYRLLGKISADVHMHLNAPRCPSLLAASPSSTSPAKLLSQLY